MSATEKTTLKNVMTEQHPITPSPELRCQWQSESPFKVTSVEREDYMIDRAAQWGADQELTECLRYASDNGLSATRMRETRRPKPPTLKEQALAVLEEEPGDAKGLLVFDTDQVNLIRRALEALPND